MPLTKRAADLITLSRALLFPILIWLGFSQGPDSLPTAMWLVLYNWTSDSLDGPLSRRSPVKVDTWLGDNDLIIDMLFSTGLLGYLVGASYVPWQAALIYLLLWFVIFWLIGLEHTLGIFYQAPIYGWFIFVMVRDFPQVSIWIFVWAVAAMIVTWPKLPKVILPKLMSDIRAIFSKD